ncbi:hypothetical protein ElyMa_001535600 [Elysia marginata]|uniref:Uncharacterized protein n=1 Tax=Elysia marginata TaxID=1093978 RepID=A0AAV4J9G8_9GAST|nr:hypothetical protein ElyMa_001535600 [Elysia marginata]
MLEESSTGGKVTEQTTVVNRYNSATGNNKNVQEDGRALTHAPEASKTDIDMLVESVTGGNTTQPTLNSSNNRNTGNYNNVRRDGRASKPDTDIANTEEADDQSFHWLLLGFWGVCIVLTVLAVLLGMRKSEQPGTARARRRGGRGGGGGGRGGGGGGGPRALKIRQLLKQLQQS